MLLLQNLWLKYSQVRNNMKELLYKVLPYIIMSVIAIGGYRYVSSLQRQIGQLQATVSIQSSSIKELQQRSTEVLQVTKRYRTDISTLEEKYRHDRGSLESTLQNAKGINRIVQQSVIDQLCSAYNGKYCIDGIYSRRTNRADSTLQNTSSKR